MLNKNDFRDEVLRRAEAGLADARRKRRRWEKILASAACFTVIVAVTLVTSPMFNAEKAYDAERDHVREEIDGVDTTSFNVSTNMSTTNNGGAHADAGTTTMKNNVPGTESADTSDTNTGSYDPKDTTVNETAKDTSEVVDTTASPVLLLQSARPAKGMDGSEMTVTLIPGFDTFKDSSFYGDTVEPADFDGHKIYYIRALSEESQLTLTLQNAEETQTWYLPPSEDKNPETGIHTFAYFLICDPSVNQIKLITEKSD